jgi:hypothetical protein
MIRGPQWHQQMIDINLITDMVSGTEVVEGETKKYE